MMAGNPNWWSMNGGGGGGGMHSPPHPQQHPLSSTYLSPSSSSTHNSQYHLYSSSTSSSSPALDIDHPSQDFPRSWSQLLTGGSQNDQLERFGNSQCQYNWFMQNGEDNQHVLNRSTTLDEEQVAAAAQNRQQLYGHVIAGANEEYQLAAAAASRGLLISRSSHQLVSSPTSCVTTLSSNLLNFSTTKTDPTRNQQLSDHSTEGHSPISGGGVAKKPRLQQSSTQPALKVRKEKLGDRITALHQLVSPFGKTDTASVLSEAIGYIRFLLGQIEALSSPYLGNVSKSMGHQHSVQEMNCLFTQEPDQDGQSHDVMDLTSRGLCLVPISCTQHVGNDNGADYWAPAFGGGF